MKNRLYIKFSLIIPIIKKVISKHKARFALILATSTSLCCAIWAFVPRDTFRPLLSVKTSGKPITESASLHSAPHIYSRLHNRLRSYPDADKQRRLLGRRFLAPGREVTVLRGIVTLDDQQHAVIVVRTQDNDGEHLTIALDGEQPRLTWNGNDGARLDGISAAGNLRILVERLSLDMPDQFVLATLRGASYHTVARAVRPVEASGSDGYNGAVWDLVRISEPNNEAANKPLSLWRLYYINNATGLIDKVVSQEDGNDIVAEISDWVNQGGELTPSRITWSRNKQIYMEFRLNQVVYSAKQ